MGQGIAAAVAAVGKDPVVVVVVAARCSIGWTAGVGEDSKGWTVAEGVEAGVGSTD